jgi:hypothetical protein
MVFAIKPGDEYISTCQSLAKHLTICYIAKQPSSQSCGTFPLKDHKVETQALWFWQSYLRHRLMVFVRFPQHEMIADWDRRKFW